jgi:hypothetical protein
MNRLNRYFSGALAALLAAAAPALCADLFADDFTDAAASHGKWVNKNSNYLSHSVAGGSCILENSSSEYNGEYFHDFGANKPATFTLSYVQKLVQGKDAGAFFCRQAGNAFSGYFIILRGGDLIVWKLTNGSSSSIFEKSVDFDLKATDNKFTVSKSGTKFNVFVNDVFAGSFTDAAYNSGDLSLFVDPKTKAVFGAVQVTDVFTEASPRTSFSDNFNGNGLKYWEILKSGSPSATEAGGVLTVRTAVNEAAWIYIDFEHPNFTAKIEASHRSGSKTSQYGFVLIGDGAPGQTIPMAYFAITGDRGYAIWKTGAITELVTNPAILGAANGGTFFVDNLELKRSEGSSAYEFLANGTPLATFPASNVGFNAVGIGLFCYGDLEVAFDNFSVIKEGSTLAINRDSKQISRAKSPLATRDRAFYDMRGRKRYSVTSAPNRLQTRAAGVYINKNGRDVAVRKGRVATE